MSYGQYRRLLATCRGQADRRAAYEALYDTYGATLNTYAALYNGVMQREWFKARARGYKTHARRGALRQRHPADRRREPDSRNQGRRRAVSPVSPLRKRVLGSTSISCSTRSCRWSSTTSSTATTGARLDRRFGRAARRGLSGAGARGVQPGRWIDVYENQGKRSGAYSAPVYGSHPYMLLNYNDTLDAVFTLAHEMGHSMHTLLSHETQPFVYAGYTIFVAEVPSTLSEALLLDLMLDARTTREERIVLLQHAIDGIVGTFYNQVLFADFELRGAPAGRAGSADHRATSERHLRPAARRLLGRCAVAGPARAAHVGAHSPLLPVAVLRLPVRHLLRVDGEVDEGHRRDQARPCRGRVERYLDASARRRQRLPDEAARARRRRSQRAGDGSRCGRAARWAGDTPGIGLARGTRALRGASDSPGGDPRERGRSAGAPRRTELASPASMSERSGLLVSYSAPPPGSTLIARRAGISAAIATP